MTKLSETFLEGLSNFSLSGSMFPLIIKTKMTKKSRYDVHKFAFNTTTVR